MVIGIHLHFSLLQAPWLGHVPFPGSQWQVPLLCRSQRSPLSSPDPVFFWSDPTNIVVWGLEAEPISVLCLSSVREAWCHHQAVQVMGAPILLQARLVQCYLQQQEQQPDGFCLHHSDTAIETMQSAIVCFAFLLNLRPAPHPKFQQVCRTTWRVEDRDSGVP